MAERNKIKETIFGVINGAIASFERDSKRLRESLGICSFAQECDSILMWSHYAQSHQGICIEYDVNCFEDHLLNNLYPVMYEDILFDFRKLVDEFSKYPIRTNLLISLVKSKVWSYEKEWRIVSPLIRNQNVSICKPKSVYLGAYISEVFENEIKSICASQGIEVFKMKNEKKKFSLIATKIS